MSVAEGLALAYLKVGVLGVAIIVVVMLLVRAIETRAKARDDAGRRPGSSGNDGLSR